MSSKDEKDQTELEKEQKAAEVDELDIEQPEGDQEPEERHDQRGLKANVDPVREAIMKKSKGERKRRHKEDRAELDQEGKDLQDAMEAEVRGEPHQFDDDYVEEPDPEAEKEPAKAEKAPDPVDSGADVVTIKVDGEEQEVSQSAINKAGIAALQKESTADKRMKDATQYEASVRTLEASVRKQLEDLQAAQTAAPTDEGSTAGDNEANLPDKGAVAEVVKEKVQQVAEAIYAGDQDQVTESLTEALTSVAQGRPSSTPPLDAKQFAEDVMESMRKTADDEKAERAAEERKSVAETVNTTFQKEFSDLYTDDRGFRLTKAEFEGLCEERPEADRVELMREAAGTVNKIVNPPVDDELARRKKAKRGADADAPSSTQRMPTDKPKRAKTRKDVVANMQRARGQR